MQIVTKEKEVLEWQRKYEDSRQEVVEMRYEDALWVIAPSCRGCLSIITLKLFSWFILLKLPNNAMFNCRVEIELKKSTYQYECF